VRSVLRERHTHSGQQQIGRTIPPRLRNTRQFLSRTLIRCPKFRRSPRHRRKLKHYDIACNLECARRLNVVRSAITRGRNWLCYRQRPPEVTDWRGRTSPCRARSGHSDLVAARVQVGHAPECDFVPAPGNPRTGGAGRGAVVLTDRPTGRNRSGRLQPSGSGRPVRSSISVRSRRAPAAVPPGGRPRCPRSPRPRSGSRRSAVPHRRRMDPLRRSMAHFCRMRSHGVGRSRGLILFRMRPRGRQHETQDSFVLTLP
jgi:hypothetical protein